MYKLSISILLILLFSSVSVGGQAQFQPQYRLRVPTAEAYISAVPQVIEAWKAQKPTFIDKSTEQPLYDVLFTETTLRYAEDDLAALPVKLLNKAYSVIPFCPLSAITDYVQVWINAILRSTVNNRKQNSVQEILSTSLEYPLSALVTPIDFDGDHIEEYLLDVAAPCRNGYMVLYFDQATQQYQVYVTTIWLTGIDSYTTHESDGFADFTGDGLPEWLTSSYFGSHGLNGICGRNNIYTWQHHELKIILKSAGWCGVGFRDDMPDTVHFTPLQVDDDPALEIELTQEHTNNWLCTWTNKRIFDFGKTAYVKVHEATVYQDTLGCAMRLAEPLMWAGDYQEAIAHYEHGLSVGWEFHRDIAESSPRFDAEDLERRDILRRDVQQYAQFRLAIAYGLTGQIEQAQTLLTELQAAPEKSEAIDALVTATIGDKIEPIAMCVAAYNYFRQRERLSWDYAVPIGIVVGRNDIVDETFPNPADPKLAGCDAPTLINQQLENHTFTLTSSPIDQLEAVGLYVNTSQQYDLNHDSQMEWLVWLDALVDPIYFVPDVLNQHYVITRVPMRQPSDNPTITTHAIPDIQSDALIEWVYFEGGLNNDEQYTYDIAGYACVSPKPAEPRSILGQIRLWRLVALQLVPILDAPLCDKPTLETLFRDNHQQVYAAAPIQVTDPLYQSIYDHVWFTWDAESAVYQPPEPERLVVTPPEKLTDAYLLDAITQTQAAYSGSDFEQALTILDNALLNHAAEANTVMLQSLHYWRGLTLELLNRPNDALLEYIDLFETVPDSPWGMLAALHLEKGL